MKSEVYGERYSLRDTGRYCLWDNLGKVFVPLEEMELETALKISLLNELKTLKDKLSGVIR
jgi:hypothetical protein